MATASGEGQLRAADASFIAVAFLGGFAFWPALIALGSLFATLAGEFGWTRSQVTTAQLIFTVASVVGAPVVGPLIDRKGVRPLLLLGLALVPVPLILIAFTTGSFGSWIVIWSIASIAGQFVAPPVWSAGIARRFGRRRGLALGIAACGFAAASAATPLILVNVVGLAQWPHFYLGMAAFLVLVLLPLTYLFYREETPLAGAQPEPARTPAPGAFQCASFRSEVLNTRRYAQFGVTVFLVSFVVGGMMIHLQPLFAARGLSASASASAYAFYGIGGIVGRLLGGWLLDRFDRGPLPALPMCIFPVIASIIALCASSSAIALAASMALLIGIAAGVEVDVVPYLVRKYFPSELFGRTYISLAAIFVAGAGASPFVVSLWFDRTGGYDGFLIVSVVMGLAAAFLLLSLGPYPPKVRALSTRGASFVAHCRQDRNPPRLSEAWCEEAEIKPPKVVLASSPYYLTGFKSRFCSKRAAGRAGRRQ